MRNRFLNILDCDSISGISELNEKLHGYIQRHNTTVHSATGMTPHDRYMEDLNHIRMPSGKDWLDNYFMNCIRRRVRHWNWKSLLWNSLKKNRKLIAALEKIVKESAG